ncbi:MAG: carboxypeptidase-like regulatory domain-containing protein [Alistipes sp.]|nr:carboxypeptidase-like regulatory domain-containing protein [Alistipes sp.]
MKCRLLLLLLLLVGLPNVVDATTVHTSKRLVEGVVVHAETGEPLQHVAVEVAGSNIGTVTNADGFFSLKLTERELGGGLKFSHMGYANHFVSYERIAPRPLELRVKLSPSTLAVDEVTIYGGTARELMVRAIEKIEANYSNNELLFTTFYRETVRKRRTHIAVSEAVMDLFKTSYADRSIYRDKVRLRKGRRLVNHQVSDTLAVKIVGGPSLSLVMDVVKNGEELLAYDQLDFYDFTLGVPAMLDNRMQHVIYFKPRVKLDYALFSGVIHIDQEQESFSRVELNLDVSDPLAASALLLHRKPAGLRFKPLGVSFLISYRRQDGCNYLNYVRSEFSFKCDWKRRLFSSNYTALSEMVMVDREENPEIIRNRDRFRSDQIFYDEVDAYADPDYWRDYNILEPTESLENAVDRLRKRNTR